MKTTKPIKRLTPIHVFFFMLSCLIVLAIVSLFMPEESEVAGNVIHTPQLTDVLELKQDSTGKPEILSNIENFTANVLQQTPFIPSGSKPTEVNASADTLGSDSASHPIAQGIDTTIDTRIYLSDFRSALEQAGSQRVRIMHYGDSQIEEDRLTSQIRRSLQGQYGGGGVGLIPLHQTVPTSTLWQCLHINGQRQQIGDGPQRYLVYGPPAKHRKSSHYGPMGQVAIMDNSVMAGSENMMLQVNSSSNGGPERYFNRIRVLKSGNISVSIDRAIDQQGDVFIVPDSTCSAVLRLKGKGEVYGISLETTTGVTADNIPMRGCAGAIFTSISSDDLQQYYQATNTKLIILEYGGNIIPCTKTPEKVDQYIELMRGQIQYLKRLAPDCSILFIGPGDMSHRKNGAMQSYDILPTMDNALLRMAIEEKIAYFSLYKHMGGQDSMVQWKQDGLAGGDYIHFTHKGANKVGEMLAQWIQGN